MGTGTGGASGAAGTSGDAGTSGTAGTSGDAGTSGSAGSVGPTGGGGNAVPTGTAGTSGSAGNVGSVGSAGSSGTSGSAGTTGGRGGTTGAAGRGGTTGAAGSSAGRGGTTGTAGGSGSSGTTGTGGAAGGAMPSAGCTSATTTPTSGRFTIDASGTSREYIIKIPANYDARHPYRLIIALHGAQYDDTSVDAGGPPTAAGAGPYYGVEPLSGGSAIFVAAQATSSGWTNANDLPYVNAMIARFESQLCIDQSRIFAVGFSMGAIETIQLGCTLGNVLRAIAPMSGSLQGRSCSGTTPIAYWGSHGTNDPTIAIAQGRGVRDTFIARNHCTTTTVAGTPAGCVNYQGCDPGKPVGWCEFDGVHQPPPYSGSAIWTFFSQF